MLQQENRGLAAQPQPLPPPNTVGAHVEGLDRQIGRMHEQLKILRSLADSLAGPRPQAISGGDANAKCEPVSHLARMLDRRAAIAGLVDDMQDEISRISEAL